MRRITLARVNLRSFLIQLLFDPQRMQGMGFLFSMLPLLRRLYEGENLARACRRHIEYFNTHPYMAAVVLGVVSRLEENGDPDRAKQAKKLLAPPLAAMGDDFFWAVLRPLSAMIGMILVIHGYNWGVILFLALYNVPHLFVRTFGFRFALMHGVEKLVGILNRLKPSELTFRFRLVGSVVLGGISGTLVMKGYFLPVNQAVVELLGCASLMVLFSYGLARLVTRRISPPTWALLIIVACILMAGLVEIW